MTRKGLVMAADARMRTRHGRLAPIVIDAVRARPGAPIVDRRHDAGSASDIDAAASASTTAPRSPTAISPIVDAIPCTTLARTLLDLAEDATRREVERAIDRAEQLRLLDVTAIDDVLARANGRRGAALLRTILDEHRAASTLTRNDLEEAFLRIARDAGTPPDAVNAWIPYPAGGGAEADFLWRAQRLIVEVDGREVHTTRRAFESDRRRDQRLMLLGWRVVRFTWRQVMFAPAEVANTLRGLLLR